MNFGAARRAKWEIHMGQPQNKQTVSCDDFLPRTHAHSHTRFSAARTSHARVRFAKDRIAHASRTCAVVRVRFIKIRTRTLTFLAKK